MLITTNANVDIKSKSAELLQRIDEVLFYIWDPLGVSPTVVVRDEYENYAIAILNLINEGARKDDISTYLQDTRRDTLGSTEAPHKDNEVANLIQAFYEEIYID